VHERRDGICVSGYRFHHQFVVLARLSVAVRLQVERFEVFMLHLPSIAPDVGQRETLQTLHVGVHFERGQTASDEEEQSNSSNGI
jgi:hypothetical protein